MEQDEIMNDDILRELIQRIPLDSPSENFVDRVMAGVQTSPAVVVARKPFFLYLKTAVPYTAFALILFFVIATSDLPLFNWVPGKDYLLQNLLPYFQTLFTIFKNAFSSKFVSLGLLISFAAGALFLIDRLLSRRTSVPS